MSDDRQPPTTPVDVPAVTLRQYYQGDIPAGRFRKQAIPEPADMDDQLQIDALLVDLRDFDSDFGKTVQLLPKRSKLPQWLVNWLGAVVERNIGDGLDRTKGSRCRLQYVFTRCRAALTSRDATKQRCAYNLLRLSLLYLNNRSPLDPLDLIEATTLYEDRGRLKEGDLERHAVDPLLRATSSVAFKKVLLSLRFWTERVHTARADVFRAEDKAERLDARVDELRRNLSTARERIQTLEKQAKDSAEEVASLSRRVEVEHNKRVNKIRETKGRVLRLFDSGLSPRLRGAREAIDGRTVAVDVAIERLDRVRELLEEERSWLSSD